MYQFLLHNLSIKSNYNLAEYFDVFSCNEIEASVVVEEKKIEFKKLEKKIISSRLQSCYATKNYAEIYREGIGKFLIFNGEKIICQKDSKSPQSNFLTFLFSYVFAYLLYQRGQVVLHASAIDIDGKSFFFSGRSGAGKSTMLKNFLNNSRFLSDDITCFEDTNSKISIQKGLPFIKSINEDKIPKTKKIFDTFTDKRKRKIYAIKDNFKNNDNVFSGGFFLRLSDENSVRKISTEETMQGILSNLFFANPYDNFVIEQRDILAKLANVIENKDFFIVNRTPNEDFDFNLILKKAKTII